MMGFSALSLLTDAPERVAFLFGDAGDSGSRWVDALVFFSLTAGDSKSYE